MLSSVITYFYMIIGFVLVVVNKRKIIREEYVPLIIFGILPILGGILQTLFYGILLMWSSTAFSLIIVYLYLQQKMIHLDKLTGTWTRDSFDYYISKRLTQKNDEQFGIIYVDIDGLKSINDQYGHLEGDYAIKMVISIIKSKLSMSDIVVRLGGDEFVIVVNCQEVGPLDKIVEQMKNGFLAYNKTSEHDYIIDCSFGADIFSTKYENIEAFIRHVDELMYESKKYKKEYSLDDQDIQTKTR